MGPSLCDLAPLDYFHWWYVKSKTYANEPATLEELETTFSVLKLEFYMEF